MRKRIYFDNWFWEWPALHELEPFFLAEKGHEWSYRGGNDNWGLVIEGLEGTEHLSLVDGRKDLRLCMWGHPTLGVLVQYTRFGWGPSEDWFSVGDLTKLKLWVRSQHSTPLPVGLFIPFPKAWLAVKEFMETEGQLPRSIEWISSDDVPDGTFPDPMDVDETRVLPDPEIPLARFDP